MTYTQSYTVFDEFLPAGRVQIVLWTNDTTLVVPSIPTIVSFSPIKKAADIIVGETELTSVTIEYRDCDGFWSNVISSTTYPFEIQILVEGATKFVGRPTGQNSSITQHALITSRNVIESGRFEVQDVVIGLRSVDPADVVTEMLTHALIQFEPAELGVEGTGFYCHFINIVDLLKSFLVVGFTQAFADTNVVFAEEDLEFSDTTGYVTFDNLYFYYGRVATNPGTPTLRTHDYTLLHDNALEWFSNLLNNFHFSPKIVYNDTNSAYDLYLMVKSGRSENATEPVPFRSTRIPNLDYTIDVQALGTTLTTKTEPTGDPDETIWMYWQLGNTYADNRLYTNRLDFCDTGRYWAYGAWQTSSSYDTLIEAYWMFLFNRGGGSASMGIEREYFGTAVDIFQYEDIAIAPTPTSYSSTRAFVSTSVEHDYINNMSKVLWREVKQS